MPGSGSGRDSEIEQMVAEYRALRATVLRLWTAASSSVQVEDLEDVTRFNEAVDQAIAESLQVFVTEVDRARDLFLGMLGHDLRGPLSTIASSATLEVRTRPNDSQRAADHSAQRRANEGAAGRFG